VLGAGAVVVRWSLDGGGTLMLAANLSGTRVEGCPTVSGRVIWQEGELDIETGFGPWTVRWSVEREAVAAC
jgi:hypothetical protein